MLGAVWDGDVQVVNPLKLEFESCGLSGFPIGNAARHARVSFIFMNARRLRKMLH